MKRYEAIEIIVRLLHGDELLISANGMISRELCSIKDTRAHFYMLGSMGLASSIGLGLALSLPQRTVVLLDGDGNILMNLGSLATIAHFAPANLIHIVLDNEAHNSTGGQPTVSSTVPLQRIADAAGFPQVRRASSAEELRAAVMKSLTSAGPWFILVKIEQGKQEVPRVSIAPTEIKRRFVEAVREEA